MTCWLRCRAPSSLAFRGPLDSLARLLLRRLSDVLGHLASPGSAHLTSSEKLLACAALLLLTSLALRGPWAAKAVLHAFDFQAPGLHKLSAAPRIGSHGRGHARGVPSAESRAQFWAGTPLVAPWCNLLPAAEEGAPGAGAGGSGVEEDGGGAFLQWVTSLENAATARKGGAPEGVWKGARDPWRVPTRVLFTEFALSLVAHDDAHLVRTALQHRPLFGPILQGLAQDHPVTIAKVLCALWSRVLANTSGVPRGLQVQCPGSSVEC